MLIQPNRFVEKNSKKLKTIRMLSKIHDAIDSALEPFGALSDEATDLAVHYEKPQGDRKRLWDREDKLNKTINTTFKVESNAEKLAKGLSKSGKGSGKKTKLNSKKGKIIGKATGGMAILASGDVGVALAAVAAC